MNWREIIRPINELLHGQPGQRFQAYYRRRREHRSQLAIALRIAAGMVLVVLGVLLSMPPLVPGFLVTLAGLGLVASQSRRVAAGMDRLECWVRRCCAR